MLQLNPFLHYIQQQFLQDPKMTKNKNYNSLFTVDDPADFTFNKISRKGVI